MLGKPSRCCAVGTYGCTVPMPINGRVQGVDVCIADVVAALNAGGVHTVASCCGHGGIAGSVVLEDGRELLIFSNMEAARRALELEATGA